MFKAEDLKTLIRHMEHWAHRLFPKLQFDDFIDKVESLGSKKEVQVCIVPVSLSSCNSVRNRFRTIIRQKKI